MQIPMDTPKYHEIRSYERDEEPACADEEVWSDTRYPSSTRCMKKAPLVIAKCGLLILVLNNRKTVLS